MSLDAEFRAVLAQMEVLSFGRVQSFNSSGGGKTEPGVLRLLPPNPDEWPLHLKWGLVWARTSEDGKARVLGEARAELKAWKKRTAPIADDGSSLRDWVLKDGETWPPEEVARRFNTTATLVRKWRRDDGRDMETGRGGSSGLAGDASQDVDELIRRGCSARQIEMLTGMKRSTAQDAINRHRRTQ